MAIHRVETHARCNLAFRFLEGALVEYFLDEQSSTGVFQIEQDPQRGSTIPTFDGSR